MDAGTRGFAALEGETILAELARLYDAYPNRTIAELGHEPAAPDEARGMVGLPILAN